MNVPRRHHFVSKFLLAGFTQDGTKEGRLYVTDLEAKRQWPSTAIGAAHERDLYQLDMEGTEGLDPQAAEKGLSKIEAKTAPILQTLSADPGRMPSQSELSQLLYFVALQVGRVPSEQPRVDEAYTRLLSALETPERWEEERKRRGLSAEEYSYDRVKNEVGTQSMQTLFVLTMIAVAEVLHPILAQRKWGLVVSSQGRFICSDRPVTAITRGSPPLPAEPGRIADPNLDVIVPLHRKFILFGTNPGGSIPLENYRTITQFNTCVARGAARFLYSTAPEFVWARADGSNTTGFTELV